MLRDPLEFFGSHEKRSTSSSACRFIPIMKFLSFVKLCTYVMRPMYGIEMNKSNKNSMCVGDSVSLPSLFLRRRSISDGDTKRRNMRKEKLNNTIDWARSQ